jgi:hypothetical protein
MNKFCNLGILVILFLVGVCVYWYVNPHHMPRFIRDSVPGFKAPTPTSPMSNFRAPQF